MKNKLCFLLLSPILLSGVGCNNSGNSDPKPVDVVVISGQSNAVGCTWSDCIQDTEKWNEYRKGYPEIQIAFDSWTKDWEGSGGYYSQNTSKNNNFVKVALGQGNSVNTFGPEIGIAEAMHEKYANKLFLIKYACGASNLKDDWAGRGTAMYNNLIEYVQLQMNNLKEMGYIPTIKAFCWMQGEGDAYDGYCSEYLDNLRLFVGNLRNDLKELSGDKDFPFIDASISNAVDPNTKQLRWPKYEDVNNAKKQFADESDNNFYIDTIAAGMHTDQEPFSSPDGAHYDTESEVLLGHLFAEAFEPFLEPVDNK